MIRRHTRNGTKDYAPYDTDGPRRVMINGEYATTVYRENGWWLFNHCGLSAGARTFDDLKRTLSEIGLKSPEIIFIPLDAPPLPKVGE